MIIDRSVYSRRICSCPLTCLASLTSLPVTELINLSRNSISSRVLDEFLDSKTVPQKAKRKFLLSLIGHYHELVDDRIGSRVADRCWASADPYLKEKIARSLIAQERFPSVIAVWSVLCAQVTAASPEKRHRKVEGSAGTGKPGTENRRSAGDFSPYRNHG